VTEPVNLNGEKVAQLALAVLRLLEGIVNALGTARRVASLVLTLLEVDLAAFRLDYKDPMPRVEERKVCLAISLPAPTECLPLDVMEDEPGVVEVSESGEDAPFGIVLRLPVLGIDLCHASYVLTRWHRREYRG
jgi:hypothetical protein